MSHRGGEDRGLRMPEGWQPGWQQEASPGLGEGPPPPCGPLWFFKESGHSESETVKAYL